MRTQFHASRPLAIWAHVGATLANDKPLDRRPTNGAGFPYTIIYAKVVLKIAAAIYPINAGAVAADALFQGGLNRFVEPRSLPRGQ
jgi:hypothetical protein